MTAGSLKFRLLAAAALSIALALTAAGWALTKMFERHVDRRVVAELQDHLNYLAANVELSPEGQPVIVRQPTAPRFDAPLAGLYWQVWSDGAVVDGSESLVGAELDVPLDTERSIEPKRLSLSGPASVPIIALVRNVTLKSRDSKDHVIRISTAIDQADVMDAVRAFQRDLAASLLVLGGALMLAAWFQVVVGLKPLENLRTRLFQVRSGDSRRLDGHFPSEVRPLVEDLNGLLHAQEQSIDRARARAGNLAHGLKTPLTALNSVARDLSQQGQPAAARDVEELVGAMSHHVERELARARVSTATKAQTTLLAPLAGRLIGTLKRTPDGTRVSWTVAIEPDFGIAIDADDLAELVGNLLENGQKWGRTEVLLKAATVDGAAQIEVEDDGTGVPDAQLGAILARGVRLDQRRPGSGLGLAIVSDIADAYGLTVEFYRAGIGGLGVRLRQTKTASSRAVLAARDTSQLH